MLGEWIRRNCHRLRELTVRFIYGVQIINVSSTSLETLYVRNEPGDNLLRVNVISAERLRTLNVWFENSYSEYETTSIRIISAPNLESLTLSGDIIDEYRLANLVNLQEAHLYRTGYDPFCSTRYSRLNPNLVDIIHGVRNARRIVSHRVFFESVMARELQHLATFERAESLTVEVSPPNSLPEGGISAFHCGLFPNLRTMSSSARECKTQ
ncbi:conserved hypothetical protein [Ricinus communis]|uniref:F-box/LRR-repeat protein 15/At3g58940/PEG3-like LRR domain-containing protein n=1 Tax=Ricinus communis TaxID=3988 RepID=B9SSU5_RICCO|nr:conserved hypothetical protein [Ricinus communis]